MTASTTETMLGLGIYTFEVAGRYAGVSRDTAKAWFKGWKGSGQGPLLCSDYAGITDRPLVSFLDFTDLLVVAKLREVNATMPSIRRAYNALKPILSEIHPFSRVEIYADHNGTLFRRAADAAGDETLVEILKSQHAFPSVLLPFLERIDYDPVTNLARTYEIQEGIVLDAQRKYGKPITLESAMPTTVLARSFAANERDAALVADWYGVSPLEVLRAVRFEEDLKKVA